MSHKWKQRTGTEIRPYDIVGFSKREPYLTIYEIDCSIGEMNTRGYRNKTSGYR